MVTLVEGMTPAQFIEALNDNYFELYIDAFTTITNADDYVNLINTNFSETVVFAGMSGTSFKNAIENKFNVLNPFPSEWNYRKSHVLENAAGAGSGYQTKIKVHYGSSQMQTFLKGLSNFNRSSSNPIMIPSETWEDNNLADPVIIEETTELRLYYTGGGNPNAIGYATSPKTYPPISWTKQCVVLPPNPTPGQWDSGWVRMGNIFKVDGVYYLYYGATPGEYSAYDTKIGLATSNDGINFTRHGSNPILQPSGAELDVENPTVVNVDATHWYMYYGYRTGSFTLPGVKVATSPDGIVWTKIKEVFTIGASGEWDDTYIEHAQIFYLFGYFIITYEGYGGSGNEPWAHGLAYSTDPLGDFVKYSGNPFFQKSGIVGSFDEFHAATPAIFFHNGTCYSIYQGGDNFAYMSSNWKFGLTSNDGSVLGNVKDIEDVFLDSHCRADFGDVRFTDSNGVNLQCWIESKIDSDYAIFWVKIRDSMESTNRTIYIYYGATAQVTRSSGDRTFLFFDHFIGDAINTTKWDGDTGDVVVASSIMTHSKTNTVYSWLRSINSFGPAIRYKALAQCYQSGGLTHEHRYGFVHNDVANIIFVWNRTGYTNWLKVTGKTGPTSTLVSMAQLKDNNWRVIEIFYISNTSCKFKLDNDNVEENTTNCPGIALPVCSEVYSEDTTAAIDKYDWIFVSKFIISEPRHQDWGNEETL